MTLEDGNRPILIGCLHGRPEFRQHQVRCRPVAFASTVWEDPFKPGRNGLLGIGQRIEVNSPLAMVILMLGTNDFQSMHRNPSGTDRTRHANA